MMIRCVQCETKVEAILTDGSEIYPHREDLHDLPFWKCETCSNFVGCHHKTKNRTNPLGCIANQELKDARVHLHKLVDPIWESGQIKRKALYQLVSDQLGYRYSSGNLRSVQEARDAYKIILGIKRGQKNV